jgi:hypothetical protein
MNFGHGATVTRNSRGCWAQRASDRRDVRQSGRGAPRRWLAECLSKNPDAAQIAKLLEKIKQKQEKIYKLLEPKTYAYEIKLK